MRGARFKVWRVEDSCVLHMSRKEQRMSKRLGFICTLVTMAAVCAAQPGVDSEKGRFDLPKGLILRPRLYGHLEAGQIVHGALKDYDVGILGYPQGQYGIAHVWAEDAIIEFGYEAIYREYFKMVFSLGAKLYFSYPQLEKQRFTKNLRQDIYFDEVFAAYHYGDAAMPLLLGQVGYFKYKYNPDARNFGDYLFRTGTYPIWFDMGFDSPWQRLLGLHFQSNLFRSLKTDLLLVSATVAPAMNWSLALLANYDIANFHLVEIGAGVDFANLFSVYSSDAFPLFGGDPTTPKTDVVNCRYIEENGDTAWYTFQGTKIMARMSIDPKALIRSKIFGENDLKLYVEADIIGVKSYPDSGISQGGQMQLVAPSYDEIWEKMPVAVGFNLPTFRLLDVLNFEFEWFGAKYYNDASNVINQGSAPLPWGVTYLDDPTAPHKSTTKWSVYVKKSFFDGHYALTGQIGRDHMRLPCASYNDEMWNELLVENKDWWWAVKTSWMF